METDLLLILKLNKFSRLKRNEEIFPFKNIPIQSN